MWFPLLWLLAGPAAAAAHLQFLRQGSVARSNCSCAGQRPEAPVSPADAPFSCCDVAVQGGPQGVPKPPDPALLPAVFALERVGLQGSGVLGLQAMSEAPQSLCLTASEKEDGLHGYGLSLQPCEANIKIIRSGLVLQQKNPKLYERQMFQLMPNGEMRSVFLGGKCVRRMHCGRGKRFVFDLGRCNGPGYTAKFVVKKPLMNSLDHLQFMGFPYKVLKQLPCERCGPFMLLENCLLKGSKHPHDSACSHNYQATPGWTKMPSQYIGDAAVHGRRPRIDGMDIPGDRVNPIDLAEGQADMAGLASTDFDGLCGSYTSDGLALESFFYFHRVPVQT